MTRLLLRWQRHWLTRKVREARRYQREDAESSVWWADRACYWQARLDETRERPELRVVGR